MSQTSSKPLLPTKLADDDWETDPDFVVSFFNLLKKNFISFKNDINEKDSRWGSKTVEGSGHQQSISLNNLRKEVLVSDIKIKVCLFFDYYFIKKIF